MEGGLWESQGVDVVGKAPLELALEFSRTHI